MKKITKILICFMLCVISICFVACDNRTEKEKEFDYPAKDALVTGNDGLAVQKGNYIYFVNGYQAIEDLTKQNASYTHGALMLMKLDENGNIVTDENNLLKDDHYITMSNRLAGFEATSLFIGGDYLYFTSPCQENEGGEGAATSPTWAKERVEFYRIKLDKTSEVERVYQSQVKHDKLEFEYYYENNKTYILVYEKETSLNDEKVSNALVRVNASDVTSKRIAKDVTSVAMAESSSEIFFVNSTKEDDETTYVLNQFNIVENETETFTTKDTTFKVESVGGGYVFISSARSGSTGLYRANIESKGSFNNVPEITSIDTLDKYYITEDGYCFVGVKGTNIKLSTTDGLKSKTITDASAESITVIGFVNGNLVYIDKANNIKTVSYYDCLNDNAYEIKTIAKVENINTTYFDLDNLYVYFYKTINEHNYLHRVKLSSRFVEGETQDEMVGVYLEADRK